MSGYNIEVFLNEFATRTKANLEYIEKNAEYANLYEVTQLINSLLGLIIIPVEKYKIEKKPSDNTLKNVSLEDYKKINNIIEECKKSKRWFCDYYNDSSVSRFIEHIRNAVAHGGCNGIHFFPVTDDTNDRITDVIFYDNNAVKIKKKNNNDQDEGSDNKEINEFCVKLSISELKQLVQCISNLYCRYEKRYQNASDKVKEYDGVIRKLDLLMGKEYREDKTKTTIELNNEELSR